MRTALCTSPFIFAKIIDFNWAMWTSGKTWETSLYEAYAFKKSSRNSTSVWVETLKTISERKATTTSRVSCSLKYQKNPTIAKSLEVSQPVHLVWDSFAVVLYAFSNTSGLLKDQVKTSDQFWSSFQTSRKHFCVWSLFQVCYGASSGTRPTILSHLSILKRP